MWILYVSISLFLGSGNPLEQKIALQFKSQKECTQFVKVVDVGVSFFRLANEDANISTFVGQCTNVAVINKKTKGVT